MLEPYELQWDASLIKVVPQIKAQKEIFFFLSSELQVFTNVSVMTAGRKPEIILEERSFIN